jgi:hypothetical protein
VPGVTPVSGDIIFSEYASDNDANGNDFSRPFAARELTQIVPLPEVR